jgi:beta-galactosidase
MKKNYKRAIRLIVGLAWFFLFAAGGVKAGPKETALPAGVKAVWDLDKAYRERTPTRERVCLNGLWRWQPAEENSETLPADGWGFFKVPGFWPGNSNYIQEDCQTVHTHPGWKKPNLRGLTAAWYQRELTVPAGWAGSRITLAAEVVNSFAIVFLDVPRLVQGGAILW